MTSRGYHDNEDTTTLILDKLGHANVEFLLNKPRKYRNLLSKEIHCLIQLLLLCRSSLQAGGPRVWRYASGCVSLAAEGG